MRQYKKHGNQNDLTSVRFVAFASPLSAHERPTDRSREGLCDFQKESRSTVGTDVHSMYVQLSSCNCSVPFRPSLTRSCHGKSTAPAHSAATVGVTLLYSHMLPTRAHLAGHCEEPHRAHCASSTYTRTHTLSDFPSAILKRTRTTIVKDDMIEACRASMSITITSSPRAAASAWRWPPSP